MAQWGLVVAFFLIIGIVVNESFFKGANNSGEMKLYNG